MPSLRKPQTKRLACLLATGLVACSPGSSSDRQPAQSASGSPQTAARSVAFFDDFEAGPELDRWDSVTAGLQSTDTNPSAGERSFQVDAMGSTHASRIVRSSNLEDGSGDHLAFDFDLHLDPQLEMVPSAPPATPLVAIFSAQLVAGGGSGISLQIFDNDPTGPQDLRWRLRVEDDTGAMLATPLDSRAPVVELGRWLHVRIESIASQPGQGDGEVVMSLDGVEIFSGDPLVGIDNESQTTIHEVRIGLVTDVVSGELFGSLHFDDFSAQALSMGLAGTDLTETTLAALYARQSFGLRQTFTTYYVSADSGGAYPEGHDDADGLTPETALRSLERVAELASCGTEFVFDAGDVWGDDPDEWGDLGDGSRRGLIDLEPHCEEGRGWEDRVGIYLRSSDPEDPVELDCPEVTDPTQQDPMVGRSKVGTWAVLSATETKRPGDLEEPAWVAVENFRITASCRADGFSAENDGRLAGLNIHVVDVTNGKNPSTGGCSFPWWGHNAFDASSRASLVCLNCSGNSITSCLNHGSATHFKRDSNTIFIGPGRLSTLDLPGVDSNFVAYYTGGNHVIIGHEITSDGGDNARKGIWVTQSNDDLHPLVVMGARLWVHDIPGHNRPTTSNACIAMNPSGVGARNELYLWQSRLTRCYQGIVLLPGYEPPGGSCDGPLSHPDCGFTKLFARGIGIDASDSTFRSFAGSKQTGHSDIDIANAYYDDAVGQFPVRWRLDTTAYRRLEHLVDSGEIPAHWTSFFGDRDGLAAYRGDGSSIDLNGDLAGTAWDGFPVGSTGQQQHLCHPSRGCAGAIEDPVAFDFPSICLAPWMLDDEGWGCGVSLPAGGDVGGCAQGAASCGAPAR